MYVCVCLCIREESKRYRHERNIYRTKYQAIKENCVCGIMEKFRNGKLLGELRMYQKYTMLCTMYVLHAACNVHDCMYCNTIIVYSWPIALASSPCHSHVLKLLINTFSHNFCDVILIQLYFVCICTCISLLQIPVSFQVRSLSTMLTRPSTIPTHLNITPTHPSKALAYLSTVTALPGALQSQGLPRLPPTLSTYTPHQSLTANQC